MSLTLEVPTELETRLREQAAHRDVAALRQLLLEAMEPVVEDLLRETPPQISDEEFEACADQLAREWAAAADPDALPLSDEAVTRAGIYREHP